MSPTPVGSTPNRTYIRGVRAVEGDAGHVLRVLVGLCLLALIGLAIALTISAASQNSRLDQLRHQGVPVEATVTGCLGISSGIGMGVEYWECRGSYVLDGHHYNEVIGGSRAHLQDGEKVPAIAVPGHPTLLSTATGVAKKSSSWTPYITSMILGGVSLISVPGYVLWLRRHPKGPSLRSSMGRR
jgi:hypothetical protein